jgi:hypothetical protein
MNLLDRARIRGTVIDYDFWLDIEGVPGRVRRERRRELHANLVDATQDVGYRVARQRLGSLRALAADARLDTAGPRWTVGGWWPLGAFVALLGLTLLAASAWVDGARATGDSGRLEGSPTLLPWVHAWVEGEQSMGFEMSLLPMILPLVIAFVLGSRAWRVFGARSRQRSNPAH